MASELIIAHLGHDLQAKKSFVTFLWSDDPSKRLGLEVPLGTKIEDAESEARKAIGALITEMTDAKLRPLR